LVLGERLRGSSKIFVHAFVKSLNSRDMRRAFVKFQGSELKDSHFFQEKSFQKAQNRRLDILEKMK